MRTMLVSLMVAVAVTLLAGCAAGGFGGSSMSPEQMAQNVKDKNAVVGCVYGVGIYGHGGAVYVDTNKINDNQTVEVSCTDGKVNITGTKVPKGP